jgi:hypothetical protein
MSRPPETRHEPTIRFVCEQDGEPERELKDALTVTLRAFPHVRRAYLARVQFGDSPDLVVTLCLSADEDPRVVEAVSFDFRALFDSSQILDVMFLREGRERDLERVCRPFYALV